MQGILRESGIAPAPGTKGRMPLHNTEHKPLLRVHDGSLLWDYPILGPVFNPPILDGTTVYIGATNGMVYALRADNGKVIWHYLIQVGG